MFSVAHTTTEVNTMADFDVTHSGLPAELETKTEAIPQSEGLFWPLMPETPVRPMAARQSATERGPVPCSFIRVTGSVGRTGGAVQ